MAGQVVFWPRSIVAIGEYSMPRSCKVLMLLCAVSYCLGIDRLSQAQSDKHDQADADAVRAASKDFLTAARKGDAAVLRKIWTPDGDFIDAAGRTMKAADLIHQLAASPSPDSAPAADDLAEATVRFITSDVAIVDGFVDRVCVQDGTALTRHYTAIWVKRGGNWSLSSLRSTAVDSTSPNEHLKPLEWLLGEWVATTDDTAILVSSRWCDEGNFILREFVVAHDSGGNISGTQRIGWDPAAKEIKSWTFDSQGGTGEDHWRRENNRWIVETVDVTADGKKGKTSSVYALGENGRFTWEVTSADVDGAKLKPQRVEFRLAKDDK
jgi:uncharacterized protein (TIGR02246 family)